MVSDNGMQQGGHLYGAVIPLQENDWDNPSTLVKDEVFEAPWFASDTRSGSVRLSRGRISNGR